MWPLQRCISDGMVQTQSKRVKSSCVNCLTFQVACRHSSECPSVAHSSSGRLISFRSRSNGSSSHLQTCWGGFRQKSAQGSLLDLLTVALLAGPKPRRHTAGSVFNVSRMPSSKIAWRLQKGEQENVLHKAFWKFLKAKFLAHCTEYTHSLGKPREAQGGPGKLWEFAVKSLACPSQHSCVAPASVQASRAQWPTRIHKLCYISGSLFFVCCSFSIF